MYTGRYKIRSIDSLRTGLADRYDASEILDSDMADCENVEVDTRTIRNAAGYIDYGGDTGPFFGIFHAKFENGTNRLIRQRGSVLEYDNGGGTWTACTLPTEGSPAADVNISELPCSFAMLNDTVLWSNGTDEILSTTDGITWIEKSSLPKSEILKSNGFNRILFLAQPAAPSRVDWSDINDPVTVGGSSFQFIGKNDGAEIMDLVVTPTGAIILFKTDRFYQISDITSNMTAVDPIGYAPCVKRTAVTTENSVIWAAPGGEIYELQGGVPVVINRKIQPILATKSDNMRGIYSHNIYRLAVPTSTDDFNSYEYCVFRNRQTGDTEQPYVITKNQRYIGCYGLEDREVAGVRRTRVYFGDGRADGVGSPAEVSTIFAYINIDHEAGVTQGLDGATQTCTFTTKFFTEDVEFFVKRYTKFFLSVKTENDQEITLGYRTNKNVTFTEVSLNAEAGDLEIEYGDGNSGAFSEGYSFSFSETDKIFESLSGGDDAMGIQFKITWTSTEDIEILSQAYQYKQENNFK